ncbi:MAG: acetolactate synthase large subunit [Acidimicrobiales bacterium]
MNGARALIQTLVDAGVDVCFTNPGTSEMHFVAALDEVEPMRGILCLFEGGATGAADGYARMAGKPAGTLLHLGPGLGNGFANLHNARRAHTPVVNIVGDHATYHKQYDAPLESDIDAVAGACSGWVRRSTTPDEVAGDAAATVAAAMASPNQVATLILPADVCWLDADGPVAPVAPVAATAPSAELVASLVDVFSGDAPAVLLVGGRVMREAGLVAAARIAAATGARVLAETFPARQERGAGLPSVDRLAYLAEFAQMQLDGAEHLVVVDTASPVSFFAYPGKASVLQPEGCEVHEVDLATDPVALLVAVADALGAPTEVALAAPSRPELPTGPLTSETVAQALGALLPEDAIVVDEANTSGLFIPGATAGAPRHDWLCLTGGAIGIGIPLATGAAVACPDRQVLCLEADGSAMYTMQALWTQVREQLDVVTVIFANHSYAVLNMELNRVGASDVGPKALRMLDLTGPTLDFVALAQGVGVPATRASTSEEFCEQLSAALAAGGPRLIEAVVPPLGL